MDGDNVFLTNKIFDFVSVFNMTLMHFNCQKIIEFLI
jgi:hypothetical protein